MPDGLRELALDMLADAEMGFGDRGERATAIVPADYIERLVKLAGFADIDAALDALDASGPTVP